MLEKNLIFKISENRKREYQHHAAVVALEQKQNLNFSEWIRKVLTEVASDKTVAEELRMMNVMTVEGDRWDLRELKDKIILLRVSEAEKKLFSETAHDARMSLSTWIRLALFFSVTRTKEVKI